MKKHKEKARGGTALVTALGMEVHRQGGGGATKQRVAAAGEERGTRQHHMHSPGHRHRVAVHWTGGGGATTLIF